MLLEGNKSPAAFEIENWGMTQYGSCKSWFLEKETIYEPSSAGFQPWMSLFWTASY